MVPPATMGAFVALAADREHILFLTGHLAEPRLRSVLAAMAPPFTYAVRNIGVKVAALMTPQIIERRLVDTEGATRILLPGRFKGDLAALSASWGVPFELGPEDLKDLPQFFGRKAKAGPLERPGSRIFAEIVEAATLPVEAILARARHLRVEGADVIDLGCLPGTPFPMLEDAVRALVAEGGTVSIDSGDPAELARGAAAGASFLLSLTENTLDLAFDTEAVPVLIPAEPGDMASLYRACERLDRAGKPYLADAILDPINFGFVESLARYRELRQHLPTAQILMGVGNLTELTDADTPGVTALLMAACVELRIDNVLVVQVSPHCRRAVREADRGWRMLHTAARDGSLPQGYDASLLSLRDRRPFPNSPAEIAESAAQVTDPNFRIEVAADGIHVYNRAGHHVAQDPFDLFPELGVEGDGGHAFYLGVELARAQIALQLGKRYAQDAELRWGCAVDPPAEESVHLKAVGTTRIDRREGKGRAGRS